jgi:cell division protein ZapA (FtsZ GTPase activity inhibitor)
MNMAPPFLGPGSKSNASSNGPRGTSFFMKQTYSVKLLGQTFNLRTENDADHVERVTGYVNDVFDDVKKRAPKLSSQEIAILSALNIAEELFKRDKETKKLIEDWRGELKEISDEL